MVICLLREGLLDWIAWQVLLRSSGWMSGILTSWTKIGNLLGWTIASLVKMVVIQVESFSRKDLTSWLSVLIRIFPEGSFLTALTYLLKGLGSLSCKT